MIRHVPNMITLGRLLTVPFLAIMLSNHDYHSAFWLFLVVGISDGLDGYIARRFNATTTTGALLDPVADKMLVITCASILIWHGLLPVWVGIPLVFRDIVMLGIGLLDTKLKEARVSANFWGKSHAALAFLSIAFAIAQPAGIVTFIQFTSVLWTLLLVTLVVSSVVYFVEWQKVRQPTREKGHAPG